MGLSLKGLWMRLLSNEVNPHNTNERHTRFLRMPCQQNTAQGTEAQVKGIILRPWNPAEFAQLYLEITWDQCLFFCFQFSSCLLWNTYNCYPMLVLPLYFVSFIHRPTDGKTLYPQNGSFPELGPCLTQMIDLGLLSWCDFGLWVDAITSLGTLGWGECILHVGEMWTLVTWRWTYL